MTLLLAQSYRSAAAAVLGRLTPAQAAVRAAAAAATGSKTLLEVLARLGRAIVGEAGLRFLLLATRFRAVAEVVARVVPVGLAVRVARAGVAQALLFLERHRCMAEVAGVGPLLHIQPLAAVAGLVVAVQVVGRDLI